MRVLILDGETMGLDFALRCVAADHEVRWHIKSNKPTKIGQGFKGIKIINDWEASMAWARDGLIWLTGNSGYVKRLDRYRELGYKIFGPTAASSALEIERKVGMEAMQAAGIEVPHYESFNDMASALKFAKRADKPYVFKPMGDEADKSLTFVPHDPAELVGWLETQIERGKKMHGGCMLQEKIDLCCEIGVSGWFGPDGFLPDKWQVCFEHKKLMDGEVGPATGEQGTISAYEEAEKLANEMLVPMVGQLRAAGHRGDFAVGAGIDQNGKAWPMEFTARTGWPIWWLQTASHKGDDPAQWMRDLLDGKDTLKVSYQTAIGVVLAQPYYPYEKSPPELVEGNPINISETNADDLHLAQVMLGKGPKWEDEKIIEQPMPLTAGEYVMCATALGSTIEQARKRVYATIDEVRFPDMMYRKDIGEKVQRSLKDCHKWGYALGVEA